MSAGKLPEEWVNIELNEIASDISYGYTASSSVKREGPHMLRITDIQNNTVNWSNVPFCQIEDKQKEKYLLADGDLVFARTGATVGKSFLIKGDIPESIYASYLIRVRCNGRVNKNFLSYFFRSPEYWSQITELSAGIGQPNVNGSKLKKLILPITSTNEQKIIAEKLDTLLAQVDSTKARLEQIPQILKRFRQAVYQYACSGRILDKVNPKITQLETLVSIHNGARKPVSSVVREGIKGIYPYYGATGIVDYLNDFTHEGRFLLVGEDGANLLSKSKKLAYIINGKSWVNNHAHVLKEKDNNLLDFIQLAINSLDISQWVSGSAQPKLTKKSLLTLPIPVFTLEEQTIIVRRVEQLFAYADTIEKQVNNALVRVNNLTQSILAKAFRGELTAQWRTENPDLISGENSAAALLEKIKAERAASGGKKAPRKKS